MMYALDFVGEACYGFSHFISVLANLRTLLLGPMFQHSNLEG
jgi:hypothetical protein